MSLVTEEKKTSISSSHDEIIIEFKDNHVSALLYGAQSRNLTKIENSMNVRLLDKGNILSIKGEKKAVGKARKTIERLLDILHHGVDYLAENDIEAAIHMVEYPDSYHQDFDGIIHVRKAKIKPRTNAQRKYIHHMQHHPLTFGVGPAGTGKTFLAVCHGVSLLMQNKVNKIILTRPAVEAGEHLGFLPGDLKDKVDPFLRPINDALSELLSEGEIERMKAERIVEIAPLAYMRGRTLKNAFILLDEAQNAHKMQMKMFLTRLGENSSMVVTGDPSQVDLPRDKYSGLVDAVERLCHLNDIAVSYFTANDITRHPLVSQIVKAYG